MHSCYRCASAGGRQLSCTRRGWHDNGVFCADTFHDSALRRSAARRATCWLTTPSQGTARALLFHWAASWIDYSDTFVDCDKFISGPSSRYLIPHCCAHRRTSHHSSPSLLCFIDSHDRKLNPSRVKRHKFCSLPFFFSYSQHPLLLRADRGRVPKEGNQFWRCCEQSFQAIYPLKKGRRTHITSCTRCPCCRHLLSCSSSAWVNLHNMAGIHVEAVTHLQANNVCICSAFLDCKLTAGTSCFVPTMGTHLLQHAEQKLNRSLRGSHQLCLASFLPDAHWSVEKVGNRGSWWRGG